MIKIQNIHIGIIVVSESKNIKIQNILLNNIKDP